MGTKGILTQIESKHTHIPKKITGRVVGLPLVQQSFVFVMDEPMATELGGPYLTTSTVTSIVSEDKIKILFKTLNSTYQLEILDEETKEA